MDNITLKPDPFLGGYAARYGDTTLIEVTDMTLMSIALPLNGRKELQGKVHSLWGITLPVPGQSDVSNDGKTRLLCLGPDSFLALLGGPTAKNQSALQGVGYTTDQSDNWVIIRLNGPLCLPALERICPIDLHALPAGDCARTSCEHLGTIIVRLGPQEMLLLSASSSARSFLHAFETSLSNVTI